MKSCAIRSALPLSNARFLSTKWHFRSTATSNVVLLLPHMIKKKNRNSKKKIKNRTYRKTLAGTAILQRPTISVWCVSTEQNAPTKWRREHSVFACGYVNTVPQITSRMRQVHACSTSQLSCRGSRSREKPSHQWYMSTNFRLLGTAAGPSAHTCWIKQELLLRNIQSHLCTIQQLTGYLNI